MPMLNFAFNTLQEAEQYAEQVMNADYRVGTRINQENGKYVVYTDQILNDKIVRIVDITPKKRKRK
jgi:hypothetical protein